VAAGEQSEIRAAGGIPWRRVGDDLEVLIIHRPRYDDWSFPKGKLDPGETWEQAAVREVWEETAIVAALGPEIGDSEYQDRHGRPKRVRYWAMSVAVDAGFEAGDEVSALRWVRPEEAARMLTYDRDRVVLDGLLGLLEG
jgi:8-oxo-dGTP pyrophosphatase MutT (NUDIX family)